MAGIPRQASSILACTLQPVLLTTIELYRIKLRTKRKHSDIIKIIRVAEAYDVIEEP